MTFPQFAFNNVWRNSRAYLTYFFSSTCMVMIFFTYAVFIFHPDIQRDSLIPAGKITLISMQVAAYIVYVFTIFFVLYSISAFLKSRNKEFGILMILGARTRQINSLIFLENMMIGTAAIITGITGGLLLSKLFLLLSTKIIDTTELNFYWPAKAIALTSSCFAALFVAISLFTLLFIHKNRVLELLQGSSKPKPEPKVSIFFSLLGVILLTISFVFLRKEPLSPEVLAIAALSGISGTYFFYSQLSVLIIRLLKKNRRHVWRGTNLLWISQISYKLKDNARMLFLVTVVMLIACTSAGFVVAVDQDNKQNYLDNIFSFKFTQYQPGQIHQELATIEQPLQEAGIAFRRYQADSILAGVQNRVSDPTYGSAVDIFRASQFNEWKPLLKLSPLPEQSGQTAVAIYGAPSTSLPRQPLILEGSQSAITIVQEISLRQMKGFSDAEVVLIVDDAFFAQLAADLGGISRYFYHVPSWTGLPSQQSEQARIGAELYAWNQQQVNENPGDFFLAIPSDKYLSTKSVTSVFSFIGIFIALIFSISTASFLYFNLHTELSADGDTYRALSKIGLSSREMSAAATKQIAFLFFVPLLIATVQTFIVLKSLLGSIRISYAPAATLIVVLAFLGAQSLYFVIARSRYVRALKKMMV